MTPSISASHGRIEATGRGLMTVCDEAVKRLGMARDESRVVIQGFGNVGSNAAYLLQEKGYRIIGVVEYDGALYNPNGIDVGALMEYRQRNGSVLGFKGAEAADSDEIFTSECDVLIPAATEKTRAVGGSVSRTLSSTGTIAHGLTDSRTTSASTAGRSRRGCMRRTRTAASCRRREGWCAIGPRWRRGSQNPSPRWGGAGVG